MTLYKLVPAVVLAGIMMACQPRAERPGNERALPAAQVIQRIEQRYRQVDPEVQVGVVVAARPDQQLVAVAEVPLEEFAEGERITFIDAKENPRGMGTIVRITDNALHIRYAPPTEDRPGPRVGDLALRLRRN